VERFGVGAAINLKGKATNGGHSKVFKEFEQEVNEFSVLLSDFF
jgi:hypothetical protein